MTEIHKKQIEKGRRAKSKTDRERVESWGKIDRERVEGWGENWKSGMENKGKIKSTKSVLKDRKTKVGKEKEGLWDGYRNGIKTWGGGEGGESKGSRSSWAKKAQIKGEERGKKQSKSEE